MQVVYDILDKIQKGEINIAKLAKESEISSSRIYKWKDRTSKITLDDAVKLAKWAGVDLDKSPGASSKKLDPPPELSPRQIYEVIQELATSVKKIEKKIQQVFPEERGNLLDVVKAIQNKDSANEKNKSDKQK